jgi:hypothetical protein
LGGGIGLFPSFMTGSPDDSSAGHNGLRYHSMRLGRVSMVMHSIEPRTAQEHRNVP